MDISKKEAEAINLVQAFMDGKIAENEFNRRNCLQIIESNGYKIMTSESQAYLLALLRAENTSDPDEDRGINSDTMAGYEGQGSD